MAENPVVSGVAPSKVENFCHVLNVGEWQREVTQKWRDTLRKR
jgi:hypothetical protein